MMVHMVVVEITEYFLLLQQLLVVYMVVELRRHLLLQELLAVPVAALQLMEYFSSPSPFLLM